MITLYKFCNSILLVKDCKEFSHLNAWRITCITIGNQSGKKKITCVVSKTRIPHFLLFIK